MSRTTRVFPRVEVIPRAEFLNERWTYSRGEHVTILGYTGSGKTFLAKQLIQHSATAKVKPVALVMKPRDPEAEGFTKELGLKRVKTWPPPPTPWRRDTRGWALWPKHVFDPEIDDPHLRAQFRRAILDCYKRGDRIIFGDETAGLSEELNLTRELKAVWGRGRSMGAGMWAASQRPVDMPVLAYNSAHHMLLAWEPDKRNRDRFGEIGGVDPDLVKHVVLGLGEFQWLYIRRNDRAMCIVDK